MILGIDEVGRGPWAGPLVVGAVVLPDEHGLDGLTDSKKLTAKRREALAPLIKDCALGWGLGWVDAQEIDALGLSESLKLATRRAVEQITVSYHEIVIDGTINFLAGTSKGAYVQTLPKADFLIPAVSAASILAKVARDEFMAAQDEIHPGYSFALHAGYGTARHRLALEQLGVSPLHRRSFAPIKKLLGEDVSITATSPTSKSTTQVGIAAEDRVAKRLVAHGHTILHRNWKTRYCEVDIISEFQDVVIFTEVKFRSSDDQGGGFAAIDAKKLARMRRAAESYASTMGLKGKHPRLSAAEVSRDFSIELREVE